MHFFAAMPFGVCFQSNILRTDASSNLNLFFLAWNVPVKPPGISGGWGGDRDGVLVFGCLAVHPRFPSLKDHPESDKYGVFALLLTS